MKLFFDLRLGYLVSAPGQESALTELQGKAGDGEEVVVQFGRSSDPTGTASIISAQTWTAENLAASTVITLMLKEDGKYSDGTALATTSTYTHDSGAKTYTFALNLNTTAINTALLRGDANAANDEATLDCQFEVTFQIAGTGPWRSSVLPVPFTLYHDLTEGSEGTPTDATVRQVRESRGADVASASALTLGNDGNYFSITGTTTITSITTKFVGVRVTLRFVGSLTLTHHATDLILPTAANIVTLPGDIAVFREYATGDWICESYQRASGNNISGIGNFSQINMTGLIIPLEESTGALPSASLKGILMFYDGANYYPIYSNGTSWKKFSDDTTVA
jgi:hypothetical protein